MMAEDVNPYASPSDVNEAPLPQSDIFVDGNCIVVGYRAVLPQRCIFTNEAVSPADRIKRRLDWAPSFRLVLRRRHCYLSYGMSRSFRHKRYRIWGIVSLITMGVIWMFLGNRSLWLLPLLPVCLAGLPMEPLKVVAFRDGRFWIAGCGEAFLSSCAQEYGRRVPQRR